MMDSKIKDIEHDINEVRLDLSLMKVKIDQKLDFKLERYERSKKCVRKAVAKHSFTSFRP